METTRDLARADPWLDSLERSRARRSKPRRSASESRQPRSARRPAANGTSPRERATPARSRPQATAKPPGLLTAGSVAALALLLVAVIAGAFDAGGSEASPTPARANVSRAAAVGPSGRSPNAALSRSADSPLAAQGARAATPSCRHTNTPTGYVNPLAATEVRPERIDQGVDYAGSGTLGAIGAGRITYVGTYGTGWPGTFIEYQLLSGSDAGCYVFYAEGVTPMPGLRVGAAVSAGQAIATIIPTFPTGMELGWGAGKDTKTYAAVAGQWSPLDDQDNVASPAGKNFSALIKSLGGPPGKVEG